MRNAFALVAIGLTLVAAGCTSTPEPPGDTEPNSPTPAATTPAPARTTTVPDVVGLSGHDAVKALEEAGLTTGVLSDAELAGVVLGVVPGEGQTTTLGGDVSLNVETEDERLAKEQAAVAAAEREEAAEAARIEEKVCAPARDRKASVTAVSEDGFIAMLMVDESMRDELAEHCPEFAADVDLASRVIPNGNYVVGTDIPAGTYQTITGRVEDCYWARLTRNGDIIDNAFISFSPDPVRVTVRDGEGFEISGCGMWVAQ